MFTGIVTDIGKIAKIIKIPAGQRVQVQCRYPADDIELGASIACSGICHTVVARGCDSGQNWFEIESAMETLQVTNAGSWQEGDLINLERAVKTGDRLDGHIVQGHIDGLAEIIALKAEPDSLYVKLRAPRESAGYIAVKGSVALEGTSLTVNWVEGEQFAIFIVPHTMENTIWKYRHEGDQVNLEVDILARYIDRLASFKGAHS